MSIPLLASVHGFNETFIQILLLLAVGVAITLLAHRFKQPYSIALVLMGLLFGLVELPVLEEAEQFITRSEVFQVMIISIFLPTLLGEATLNIPYAMIKKYHKPILVLSFGGTFLSFILIGWGSYTFLSLPLVVSFTFAALMCPTDPISVLSIFKTLGVPKKLTMIIEGESLFNDGIAVVLFSISSVYLLTYIDMGWAGLGAGTVLFLQFVLGGLAVGGILGILSSLLLKTIDNYPLEITISLLLFFGSFFIAELMHVSGVIAVVVAGLIFGNYGSSIGMSPVTKLNIKNFWDVIAFIANSLIFLMVGLEINHISFGDKWGLVLMAIVIVILSRSIALYASTLFIKTITLREKHLLNWGGLKGSLSIALALSLPPTFEAREDVLMLTFSVVLFSLLVQGITLKPLISMLGILPKDEGIDQYEDTVARIHRIRVSLKDWENMKEDNFITEEEYRELSTKATIHLKELRNDLASLYEQHPHIKQEQLRDAERDALYTQYQNIEALLKREIISESVANKQKREILEEIERN
ncbi:sodium:proton antiporter (plasmid) [Pontibacillus sp. ALD_SL1]|uniref:cation:proton antiporter n=1 Tax=Pontibacillus sp. ALD_SL1 TaxID=2777185 RepID=UPI001A963F3F|nr:sodium:proton antiporter [Pontibacillus sp. ALD_SL1]QST02764.1 sodium:proton antiporter [Pontibacillus sp. ALD_SL1]